MRTHGSPTRGERRLTTSPINEGRFGRMFRRLPSQPAYSLDELEALATTMREPDDAQPAGGWSAGGQTDGDNPTIPAAYTYLGQFVDHDITFDPVSNVDRRNDPDALVNFRSPRFDLDSVYGSGPADEPFQYERDGIRLLLEPNTSGEMDLPRVSSTGVALIGDPRNDENTIVGQLQLVFIRLHNRFVRLVEEGGVQERDRFAEAQRLTRWHYQWVVLNDFLPKIVGEDTYAKVVRRDAEGMIDFRRRFYRPKANAYMPVEFSGAAYRYGHSQVRAVYDLNADVTGRPIFLPGDNVGPLDDLRGFRPLPQQWTVDWTRFTTIDGSQPQLSRKIDGKLTGALFDLPGPAGGLALANLRRGQALGLPAGQDVARFVGTQQIFSGADLGVPDFDATPLWFYLLKESELLADGGVHLGPTGGRIVAEVLTGLLELDKQSFVNSAPCWRPEPPVTDEAGELDLGRLISFALS